MKRSERDVPGWMVADLYFDYLHSGDARPLRGVFYHNEMDVVSMAALLNHMSALVAEPLNERENHRSDLNAIGKLYADLGDLETAAQVYRHCLTCKDFQNEAYWDALERLSFVHKKRGEYSQAIDLWQHAVENGEIYAHVELAKVKEHRESNFEAAFDLTKSAVEIVGSSEYPDYEHVHLLPA